jgi:hypothetical protein
MMLKALFKTKYMLVLPLLTAIALLSFQGCDDSGVETEPPPVVDTSVVFFDNIAPMYWQNGTNDTSQMGVNLYEGLVRRQVSTDKDMELIDDQNNFTDFYFRSGDLSFLAIGTKTRFNRIYENMDTTTFDTVSVIPDSDTNLTPLDFTSDDTYNNGAWNFFVIGQTEQPVYSFYLEGRNTNNNYIYGMFHVKSIEQITSTLIPPSNGILVTIDIKLNKAGKNKFTK